ncbi:MAG: YicC family protein [OM182 bacterium]|nr:MAG: YicC family protein [OM182 bacterium]
MSNVFSMTGFATVEHKSPEFLLVWELRTVNQRFLETTFRLPEALRSIEQSLRDSARQALTRGKLDASLKLESQVTDGTLAVNESLLEAVLTSAQVIAQKAPQATPLSQNELLAWPGVLSQSGAAINDLAQAATALFEQGLEQLIAARAEEGSKLQSIVRRALQEVSAQLEQLEPLAQSLPALQRQKLQERVDELTTKIEPERLAQEVVLLAQKADIREELDRLRIHVTQSLELINGQGPHGRRLDFLTQELNREANTLGAKSVCAETSAASIELKVIIEQIREQVQNME